MLLVVFKDGSSTQFCSFEAESIAKLLQARLLLFSYFVYSVRSPSLHLVTPPQRHVAAHHSRRRAVSQALYTISQQLAVPATPVSSSDNFPTWDTVWLQCCRAAAGVFTADSSLPEDGGPQTPQFAARSKYWASFGFAGGSPDDASPCMLSASALASFCNSNSLVLQGILNDSNSNYPFCSTFLAVTAVVFELIGLPSMHRFMNLLDAPSDPPLLQLLCRVECTRDMTSAVFELCSTAMQLFDFLWRAHHAHPSQLDSIAQLTAALLAQSCGGHVTTFEGFRNRLSTLAACLPNVAVHLRLPEGVML
jgi:hypothetical protein